MSDKKTVEIDKKLARRLLYAIHAIEDIAAHSEMLPRNIKTETERKLHDSINSIYKIAHVSREPRCIGMHGDWESEFQRIIDSDWTPNFEVDLYTEMITDEFADLLEHWLDYHLHQIRDSQNVEVSHIEFHPFAERVLLERYGTTDITGVVGDDSSKKSYRSIVFQENSDLKQFFRIVLEVSGSVVSIPAPKPLNKLLGG